MQTFECAEPNAEDVYAEDCSPRSSNLTIDSGLGVETGAKRRRRRRRRSRQTSQSTSHDDSVSLASLAETADELANQGTYWARQEQFDEAIELFSQAITLQPSVHGYYGNRSLCFLRTGDLDKALNDITLALHFDPTSVKYLLRKARALRGLKRVDDACQTARMALAVDAQSEQARRLMEELDPTDGFVIHNLPRGIRLAAVRDLVASRVPNLPQAFTVRFLVDDENSDGSTTSALISLSQASTVQEEFTDAISNFPYGLKRLYVEQFRRSMVDTVKLVENNPYEISSDDSDDESDWVDVKAKSQRRKVKPPATNNSAMTNVFVSKLPVQALKFQDFFVEIHSLLRSQGDYTDFCLYRQPEWAYCFLKFPDATTAFKAQAALDGYEVGGCRLVAVVSDKGAAFATESPYGASPDYYLSLKNPSPVIRVDNVDGVVTAGELNRLFHGHQRTWRDYPTAYFQYANATQALEALRRYQGETIGNSKIIIAFVHSTE